MRRQLYTKIKPALKFFAEWLYPVFNLFYYPLLRAYYNKKIKGTPKNVQLFLLTRQDFGTFPLLLHYMRCWQEKRGPACLVVLTAQGHLVRQLKEIICPTAMLITADHRFTRWIPRLFRTGIMQFQTMNRLYCRIACRWPHALFIFDQGIDIDLKESVSSYVRYFDAHLSHSSRFSPSFVAAYLNAREVLDYRQEVYRDCIRLHHEMDANKRFVSFQKRPGDVFDQLQINNRYVVVNINCKDYADKNQNRKRIFYPERYDALFDFLIAQGYDVVLQGRLEQPVFAPRRGLIDYSKSPYGSIKNDFKLYAHAECAILSKTGAELIPMVTNTPTLVLNSVELSAMQPNVRYRYFPKHLQDRNKNRFLSWEELLQDPCFFDIGRKQYNPDVKYLELESQELIQAAEEFLPLLARPVERWLDYTPLQQKFMRNVSPLHIDLSMIKGVPCECYLEK